MPFVPAQSGFRFLTFQHDCFDSLKFSSLRSCGSARVRIFVYPERYQGLVGQDSVMPSPLFQWLKQAENVGLKDSEGSIAVDFEQAWEKLAHYQLSEPEFWILKVVQAANLLGSPLSVSQTRCDTIVRFVNSPNWDPKELKEATFSSEQVQGSPLSEFSTALRVLISAEQVFCLALRGLRLFWNGSRFESHDEPDQDLVELVVSHFKVGESRSLFSLRNFSARRRAVNVAVMLERFCRFSAVPISLDTRPVGGLLGDSAFGLIWEVRPLGVLQAKKDSEWAIEVNRGQITESDLLHEGVRCDLPDEKVLRGQAISLVSAFFTLQAYGKSLKTYVPRTQTSRLFWVKDGVIVELQAIPHEGSIACLVVASAQGLQTDLSGLALVKSERYFERRESVLEAVSDQVHAFCSSVDRAGQIRFLAGVGGPRAQGLAFAQFGLEDRTLQLRSDLEMLSDYNFKLAMAPD